MIVTVSTLEDRALDWAVAWCQGGRWNAETGKFGWDFLGLKNAFWQVAPRYEDGDGNSIIDKCGISTLRQADGTWSAALSSTLLLPQGGDQGLNTVVKTANASVWHHGPTRMTAALRCYVWSCAGAEIDIPEDFIVDLYIEAPVAPSASPRIPA